VVLSIASALVAAAALFWFRPAPSGVPGSEAAVATPGLPWFEDVTRAAGIDFQHFDSATPEHRIEETFGSGLAWIDFDADGWLDLFAVQAGPVHPAKHAGPLPTCKLYRNRGDGTFADVSAAVGLTRTGFGMGCAVGDYDNDGFDDLLVTYVDGLALYHNEPDRVGGRRLVDVTAAAGLDNPAWGTSAAWGDLDGDGLLDLYVCTYVVLTGKDDPLCRDPKTGLAIGCAPTVYPHRHHKLYHNRGKGVFADVSREAGITAPPPAPGLGVIMIDLDGDGRLDIYVANDMKPAYLFHNQGGLKFVEKALFSGAGLDGQGSALAGMGVDAADLDDTGLPSLFVTNFQNDPNILFRNQGKLRFIDATPSSGLGFASLARLGFGTVFLDGDLDGNLDVAVANGHVQRPARELFGVSYPQEAQFFRGEGPCRFRDISDKVGPYFRARHVGRGLALGDFDNDGRPDLAFSNNAGPIGLLRNATKTENAWISLELVGAAGKSNRNAIGARVEIHAAQRQQTRFVHGGASYLSGHDRRLVVGLAKATSVDKVVVTWPSGTRQEFGELTPNRAWVLRERQKEMTNDEARMTKE
jgi:hypothetical protein